MAHQHRSPIQEYLYQRLVQKLSPTAAAISVVTSHCDNTTQARDRINVIRTVCPPHRQFEVKHG